MSSSRARDYDEDDYGFDDESVISDISESSDSVLLETFVEIYRYKVIYPGGTFVRISPDLKAEKTKIVLRFGEIFEASKSIVLDGINYVKLANNSGWVFARHHDKEVLELIDCIRKPVNNTTTKPSSHILTIDRLSVDRRPSTKVKATVQTAGQKAKNSYWKGVRTKVMDLKSFSEFEIYSREIKIHPMLNTGVLTAIEADDDGDEKVVTICKLICRISAICKQCSHPHIVNGFEAAMWLFVHLGSHSRCAHALTLAVDASNVVFDELDLDTQSEILTLVLEISGSSRRFLADLSKVVSISDADIGNFLQRWMMLKITCTNYQHHISSNNSVGSVSSAKSNHSGSSTSRHRSVRSTLSEDCSKSRGSKATETITNSRASSCGGTEVEDDRYNYNDRRQINTLSPNRQDAIVSEASCSSQQQRQVAKPEGFWRILSKELGFL
jgi:hypothetical protein